MASWSLLLTTRAAADTLHGATNDGVFNKACLRRLLGNRRITSSTCFSGIGAPETGSGIFTAAVTAALGEDLGFEIQPKWAVELKQQAQQVLMSMPHPPEHVHQDVLDFLPKRLRRQVDKAMTTPPLSNELKHQISSCALQRSQWCVRSGTYVDVPRTEQHIAGSPCTEHSHLGKQVGLGGGTAALLYTWIAIVRNFRFPIFVHENVAAFPDTVFNGALGDLYFIVRLRIDSYTNGWPDKRDRVWDIGVLKAVLDLELRSMARPPRMMQMLEQTYKNLFNRTCEFGWTLFLFAGDAAGPDGECDGDDWPQEKKWAASRALVLERHASAGTPFDPETSEGFELLTDGELVRWHGYQACRDKVLAGPGQTYFACDVGQNPTQRRMFTDAAGVLPTLTCGMGLYFFDDLPPGVPTAYGPQELGVRSRFITQHELLEIMGFPIRKSTVKSLHGVAHAFSASNQSDPFGKTHSSMSRQCGNSQHVGVVGPLVMLLSLTIIPEAKKEESDSSVPKAVANRKPSASAFHSAFNKRRCIRSQTI